MAIFKMVVFSNKEGVKWRHPSHANFNDELSISNESSKKASLNLERLKILSYGIIVQYPNVEFVVGVINKLRIRTSSMKT